MMDARVKETVTECTEGSDNGRLTFPQVVMKLIDAGVEHYHADLRRSEKTYYMPEGDSAVITCHAINRNPAKSFSAAGVEAAVRSIQRGQLSYSEFCDQIAVAGCIGYFVSIVGRRAVYYGRTQETYVEPFPPAQ
jgi:uncharacterized protein YbcV (DUF1398 family)